jgi:hypothetical protein
MNRFLRERAQRSVNRNNRAPTWGPVKKCTFGNAHVQLLFQTERLSANLNFVSPMCFGFAALVFHRDDAPVTVKFHHIANAVNPECMTRNPEAARAFECASRFVRSIVRPIMQHAALGGEPVFGPLLIQVNERTLPLTIEQVLKRGDRERVVFGHGLHKWIHKPGKEIANYHGGHEEHEV